MTSSLAVPPTACPLSPTPSSPVLATCVPLILSKLKRNIYEFMKIKATYEMPEKRKKKGRGQLGEGNSGMLPTRAGFAALTDSRGPLGLVMAEREEGRGWLRLGRNERRDIGPKQGQGQIGLNSTSGLLYCWPLAQPKQQGEPERDAAATSTRFLRTTPCALVAMVRAGCLRRRASRARHPPR